MAVRQEAIDRRLQELERQQKKLNLKISGLATPTEGLSKTRERRHHLDEFLGYLSTAGIPNVRSSDNTMTRVIKIPGQPGQVLLIRFAQEDVRDRVYAGRTRMKMFLEQGKRIFINEDLTKADALKLNNARKDLKAGRLSSVWTFNGKVFAKAGTNPNPFCISDSTLVKQRGDSNNQEADN